MLRRDDPECFPKLRGGSDFCKNSAAIREFYRRTPAARDALIGLKSDPFGIRVKGLVLEAIVWRTAMHHSFPEGRVTNAGARELSHESFALFVLTLSELQRWETSPAFGELLLGDLKQHPRKKKYIFQLKSAQREIRELAWPVLLHPQLAMQPKWLGRLQRYSQRVSRRSGKSPSCGSWSHEGLRKLRALVGDPNARNNYVLAEGRCLIHGTYSKRHRCPKPLILNGSFPK